MTMKKAGLEIKVGLFVIAALGILFYLVFRSGDFYMKPGYTVRFVFSFVQGIDKGTPVKLAGVTVGEVKEIHVVRNPKGETQVEVGAWIAQGVAIEDDAKAVIKSLGMLGEKYIEIIPGTPNYKLIANGSTLIGKNPFAIEDIAEGTRQLIAQLQSVSENINGVVGDPEFKSAIKGTFVNADRAFSDADVTIKNFTQASEDLKQAASSAKIVLGRMRDGEGTVGRLLKNDQIARDLEAFTADIKEHPWKLLKKG